jgi:hypothetical protein
VARYYPYIQEARFSFHLLYLIFFLLFLTARVSVAAVPAVQFEQLAEEVDGESDEEERDFHHMVFIPLFASFWNWNAQEISYDGANHKPGQHDQDSHYDCFEEKTGAHLFICIFNTLKL